MGPTPSKELPFKCRMLQSAAKEDVQVEAAPKPKDGKFDVMLPVAFPDEGTFDWLENFERQARVQFRPPEHGRRQRQEGSVLDRAHDSSELRGDGGQVQLDRG